MKPKYDFVREITCVEIKCIYCIGLYCQCKPDGIAPNSYKNCKKYEEFKEKDGGKDV